MGNVVPDVLLDTRSLTCPIPVLKTKKAIDSMLPGQVLDVSVKDATATSDILHFIQKMKLELIDINEQAGHIRIRIKKQ